ncbi:De-etiolated protein 1 Det1-domain-containing protein [Hyaloraphidium curvatum]|nr:De-etiolated protein 1 Det1-domain-containing protein [Hyaloraphidium curvatum]
MTAPRGFTVGGRRLRRQNVVAHLRDRELGGHAAPLVGPNSHLQRAREVYWNVYPRRTLYDVQLSHEHQMVVFRKFSPDGKYIVCFSKGQHAVAVFRYKGPGYPEDAISHPSTVNGVPPEEPCPTTAFSTFFEFQCEATLTSGNELLCKDFSLFAADKRTLVLASAVPSTTTGAEARRNPSSLTCLPSLDDVTFWSVDVETGKTLGRRTFKSDFVYLSHLAGVHLYDDQLAVTSVQDQTIHILRIRKDGGFEDVRSIGWLLGPDDQACLARAADYAEEFRRSASAKKRLRSPSPDAASKRRGLATPGPADLSSDATVRPSSAIPASASPEPETDGASPGPSRRRTARAARFEPYPTASRWSSSWSTANGNRVPPPTASPSPGRERQIELPGQHPDEAAAPLSGLKQRVLSFLFRRAAASGSAGRLRHFHLAAGLFQGLVMWRCQFLDANRLLIKFGAEENVVGKASRLRVGRCPSSHPDDVPKADPPANQTSFFVIFDIPTSTVLGAYDSSSDELLRLYETVPGFRGVPHPADPAHFVPSVANSLHAREAAARQMHAVWKAKNGGILASVRRILSPLPHNPQAHQDSPYLDPGLYSYDDRAAGPWERPRLVGDAPVRFWSRATGERKFAVDPYEGGQRGARAKRFATVAFHPTDPFAISVLYTPTQGSVVNLHVR